MQRDRFIRAYDLPAFGEIIGNTFFPPGKGERIGHDRISYSIKLIVAQYYTHDEKSLV
jgi:hypothetical protein